MSSNNEAHGDEDELHYDEYQRLEAAEDERAEEWMNDPANW